MTKRHMLWLLAMFAGIGLMIWLIPPREIEHHVNAAEEGRWRQKEPKLMDPPPAPARFTPHPARLESQRYTVCSFAGPCWEAPWGANPVPIGTKY